MGNLCPAFRQRGERWRDLPISAVSQLLLAQNNQYAKVYVEVTYSATAHSPLQTLKPKLWTSVLTSEQQEA